MQRRTVLGAAAALATLPTLEAATNTNTDADPPETQVCDICDGDKPAGMVERTTIEPIAPLEADICRPCQRVQTHDTDDGHCMQCGDTVSPRCYAEVEFPLGAAALPGRLAGQLCGDCAASVACGINDNSSTDDETRHMNDSEAIE